MGGGVACDQPGTPVEKTYKITFDSDGGSDVPAVDVVENTPATKPADPTKAGYTFAGWFNGDTAYIWDTPVTSEINLTAKWDIIEYTIEYELPEGSTNHADNPTKYTTATDSITELKNPTLPVGLTFLGWYTDNEYSVEFTSIEKGSIGNIVIYAKYTDKQTFTVTYYIGDKANTKLEEKDAVFTLTGYDLFTDKECTKAYKDPITSDTILYAKVKKMTVKFDSNGGSAVEEKKVDYNTAVAKPTDPTLDGSTFQGWTLDGKAYDFNAKVTKDITLKATWKANAAEEPEEPEDPTTPTIPTTVEVTKNDDGSFSFADGTYTFVLEGDNPVLKFSMPEDVPCTVGDKLKLTGSIDFGEKAVYRQLYIQSKEGVPLLSYNMFMRWNEGISGKQNIAASYTIEEIVDKVEYCESFKDCKFVLSAPMTEGDKTLINVVFSNVKMTYEKVDPNAVQKTDLDLNASTWGWGYNDASVANDTDGSLIIAYDGNHGAGSFGYGTPADWSEYKTFVVELGEKTNLSVSTYAQVVIQNTDPDGDGPEQPKSKNMSIDVSKTAQVITIDLEVASVDIDLTDIKQVCIQAGNNDVKNTEGDTIQVTACYLTK